jgi:hypothetical protein
MQSSAHCGLSALRDSALPQRCAGNTLKIKGFSRPALSRHALKRHVLVVTP